MSEYQCPTCGKLLKIRKHRRKIILKIKLIGGFWEEKDPLKNNMLRKDAIEGIRYKLKRLYDKLSVPIARDFKERRTLIKRRRK